MNNVTISKSEFDSLDSYEMRLLCYYRFVQEEGKARTTARETAKAAKLSSHKLIQARRSLEEKGLIDKYEYVRGSVITMK